MQVISKYFLVLVTSGLASGCSWEPAHDNPLDPDSPNFPHTGSLTVNVVTLNRLPIPDATVIISELGRFTITNVSGVAQLDNLEPGSWWVHAYRDQVAEAIYARDSVQVVIRAGMAVDTTLQLNALPKFTGTGVYAVTEGITDDELRYLLRFRATVTDPDGQADLSNVRWTKDSTLTTTMQYQPDSAYWWSDLPADSFPGKFDDALGMLFYFEALDQAGFASRSPASHIWRIIHEVPILHALPYDGIYVIQPLNLAWTFYARDFDEKIRDSSQYNFLARIFDESGTGTPVMVYSISVAPTGSNLSEHALDFSLPPGRYYWEVYMQDKFGNIARSKLDHFEIQERG